MLQAERGQGRRSRIGRYLLTGRLGRGGMGMVYRGLDETLEREVAIKTLTTEGTFDEESRRRFEIEAKAAARLQHPNILTVFELGEDRGVPYIAMELLPGADLESLLRSGEELLLAEKLDIVVQICRGLAFAHEHSIVHRDIKPSNIRILDDGTAKIMDFGIAKLSGTTLTKSGMMVGTVHYMSPEQVRAESLDGRSDVFSVGVILYELLAGRRPFSGGDPTQVLFKLVHDEPPPLDLDLGPVTERLRGIVGRALAKDREKRFGGAALLADELASVEADLRRGTPTLPSSDQEEVDTARRSLKAGRHDECLDRLRAVAERHPQSLEARRALRTAKREIARRHEPETPQTQEFPELEATFKSPPTQTQPETRLQPTTVLPSEAPEPVASPAPSAPERRWLVPALAGGLALCAAVVILLTRQGSTPQTVALPAPTTAPSGTPPPPKVVARTVPVSSVPTDADVSLDGRSVGRTPLTLTLEPGPPHVLELSRAGYVSRKIEIDGQALPANVSLELVPAVPPGTVLVTSSYPIDVSWKGRALAQGQISPQVTLPAGRQALTLSSKTYFMNDEVVVDVPGGGSVGVTAPELGRLSIRATPDNCEVFIDGIFADFPPIHEKPVASGRRTVRFKWRDGEEREEKADVPPGRLAYVTGRRD
jgi:serine/threonine protein kinase